MSIDFINDYIPDVDYASEILKINVKEFSDKHKSIVDKYITPKRAYIKTSARGILAKEVSFDTLAYIYDNCHQCSQEERFRAMVVCLYNFYQKTKNLYKTQQLQKLFINTMKKQTSNEICSFDWVDEHSKNNNVFYVLELTIGANKFLKYGITSERLRNRLATLKSDIKSSYNKQSLNIKVLMILECDNNKTFEEEVKILISENNFKSTNYNFRGYTETLKYDLKFYDLVSKASENNISKVLYDSRKVIVKLDIEGF